MKNLNIISIILITIIGAGLISCRSQPEISGQIFSTDRSVQIMLVDEKAATEFIKSKEDKFDAEQKAYRDVLYRCPSLDSAELKSLPADDYYNCMRDLSRVLGDYGSSFFIGRMPALAASTTTDSQGKFKVKLPKPGKYLLMASSFELKENGAVTVYYRWLKWVNADGKSESIALTKENTIFDDQP